MTKINFESLFKYARKPKIFEQSNAPFWDYEHISKGMLEAHCSSSMDKDSIVLD